MPSPDDARLIEKAREMFRLLHDCKLALDGMMPMYVGNGVHEQTLQQQLAALITEVEGEQ